MSNHSVIEHRANYHFVKMEEDYLAICSRGVQSPHCKALILSILEHWTNTKRDRGESEYVYMSIPQWIQYTYMLYERNVITDCIAELMNEGFISRRPLIMYGQKTFEYCLNVEPIQMCIRMLAQKGIEEVLPNLDGYLAYKIATKERREAAKAQVGEKSRTYNKVGEKSHGVREKSRKVGDNSRRGYVKNQRNLDSNTKISIDSTKKDSLVASATAHTPDAFDEEAYHALPLPVTYTEALAYLKPHGPHDELDAVEVMVLARKLWTEDHTQGAIEGQSADNSLDTPHADETPGCAVSPALTSSQSISTAASASEARDGQQTPFSPYLLVDAEKPTDAAPIRTSQASGKRATKPVRATSATLPASEPDMSGAWSNETIVQYAEWCNGRVYTGKMRDAQLAAAEKLHKDDKHLTMQQYKLAHDERYDSWWREHKRVLHVTDMKAREPSSQVVRVYAMLDRLETRGMQQVQRATLSAALAQPVQRDLVPPPPKSREQLRAEQEKYRRHA